MPDTVEVFEYDPSLLNEGYRLWQSTGSIPNKDQMNVLRVMSTEERHTFVNDLLALESVVSAMKMTTLIEDRIKLLVSKRQYDDARKLAKKYPDDSTAQQYLRDIDTLETPIDRGAKTAMKYLAYAGIIVLIIMIGIVVFTVLSLR